MNHNQQLQATFFLACFIGLMSPGHRCAGGSIITDSPEPPHRGVWQVELVATEDIADPFFDVNVQLIFVRPDRSEVKAEAFFRGEQTWVARAYCDQLGRWTWRSAASLPSLDGRSGAFDVRRFDLPGKLRKHPRDPHQFVYDNGRWFLHLGDTGYRYLADTEPLWQQYIDEAAQVGFTKIRTWFCRSRGGVEALFTRDRGGLDLAYWNEMERRLAYALEKYPHIQFQLILYGEDTAELLRYGQGDRASQLVAKYAQARFSAFPTVHWCISNDREISSKAGGRNISPDIINQIGRDMRAREPWGTLLTNHQSRFSGYSFAEADWSDIVTLEDMDQVAGEVLLKYRKLADDPVVNDEDRYGIYRSPAHDRYFFRRLMWASLLSGGHATYGGLETYEAFAGDDKTKGVQGYLTAVQDGRLDDGAQDFKWIRKFFEEAELTLVDFEPADKIAGGDAPAVKAASDGKTIVVYAHNPDLRQPEKANAAESPAEIALDLPQGDWSVRWFDPRSGQWHKPAQQQAVSGGSQRSFTSPFNGDAILLLLSRGD
jgi:hypothetical protein